MANGVTGKTMVPAQLAVEMEPRLKQGHVIIQHQKLEELTVMEKHLIVWLAMKECAQVICYS